jgi:hypothetical protein
MSRYLPKNSFALFLGCCIAMLVIVPSQAFTANSLDITLDASGDAVAKFQFTLEDLLENAIPQSMLEEELLKGLTISSEPPKLLSMDRSSATILMKKFADKKDVPQGTEYQTAPMNFQKAEIALKSSALSSVITADFSPSKIIVTFPDAYTRKFSNAAVLPSITHTIIDPAKAANAPVQPSKGTIDISSSPELVHISLDDVYIGDSPARFDEITPNEHTLTFSKEGYSPVTRTVNVIAGQTVKVSAILQYAAPTPAPVSYPVFGFEGIAACLAVLICMGIIIAKK